MFKWSNLCKLASSFQFSDLIYYAFLKISSLINEIVLIFLLPLETKDKNKHFCFFFKWCTE